MTIEQELLKRNIILMAKFHKEHCQEECGISLYLVRQLAEKAGIKFNDDEIINFI